MKKVITESDIVKLNLSNIKKLYVTDNTIITPLAKDSIKESGISVIIGEDNKVEANAQPNTNTVALGCDHTGLDIKLMLIDILKEKGFKTLDLGTNTKDSCDYPDFAFAVASKVALKEVDFGIIVDATGIPSSITANKVPTVRACTCYNEFSARSAREHNNGNVLVVGAKSLGEETIKSILDVWLSTEFGGDRHQRRLDKITEIEELFLKKRD
ncbi:MAG: ribose 5-phosphate isomerase B [Melioribacteraceae bacterium]|nr:ribose 5-phosphate isomerase B [Melioribacteraceae bacterium]